MHSAKLVKQVLVLFGFSSIIPAGWPDGLVRTFKSKDYSYTVRYPSNWYRGAKRPDDPLDITDFPPSEAIHAVYMPRGGAEMMVAPIAAFHLRETPQTLDAWLAMDTSYKRVISDRTFELDNAPRGMGRIIEVRTLEGDPALENVSWYFHFQGRLFKAMLLFWRGNPSAERLVQMMNQVVLSVRLNP